MAILLKRVETYRFDTIEAAESFLAEEKKDPEHEGYEIKSYKTTVKEKKSKGEVVDSWVVLSVDKVWND